MGFLYIILNKENGKFYLGSTKNIKKRKSTHFRQLKKGKHHSIYLQRAYDKYGTDAFIFVLIETSYKYIIREQELLDNIDFKDSYNISKTATGGDMISNHPDRDKIIAASTKRLLNLPKQAPRYKEANSNWRGGKTFCDCGTRISSYAKCCINCIDRTKENNSFYGKTHSLETKKKLSQMRKGKYSGNQEKPVLIEGIQYKSLSSAARSLGKNVSTVLYRINSPNPKFESYLYK